MLPTEIEKIQAETQKIEDELFKPKEPKPLEKPEDKPKEEEKPVEEPRVEPKPEPKKESEPKVELEPKKPEDFEHKFKVLKGKYDKEIPRAYQEAKEFKDRTIVLEDENARLRGRVAELEVGPKPKEEPKIEPKIITLDEIEKDPEVAYVRDNFPDVYKAIKKVFQKTAEVITPNQGLKTRVEKIEDDVKKVAETTTRTALENFHKHLDDNIEGWRVINHDPKFKEWLQGEDRYSGKTKMALIQEAINGLDASKVAVFFEDFAQENSVDKPIIDTDNKNVEVKKESIPKKDLVPPKGITTAPPSRSDADKEIITTEHITDFYDKLRRGWYIGREAEAKAEEKKIEQAVVEGRVK